MSYDTSKYKLFIIGFTAMTGQCFRWLTQPGELHWRAGRWLVGPPALSNLLLLTGSQQTSQDWWGGMGYWATTDLSNSNNRGWHTTKASPTPIITHPPSHLFQKGQAGSSTGSPHRLQWELLVSSTCSTSTATGAGLSWKGTKFSQLSACARRKRKTPLTCQGSWKLSSSIPKAQELTFR